MFKTVPDHKESSKGVSQKKKYRGSFTVLRARWPRYSRGHLSSKDDLWAADSYGSKLLGSPENGEGIPNMFQNLRFQW